LRIENSQLFQTKVLDMSENLQIQPINIISKIHSIRDQKVMLDFDLAEIYGVQTKVLNQAVKRNIA